MSGKHMAGVFDLDIDDPEQAWTLLAVARYTDQDGRNAYPTVQSLSEDTGYHQKKVQRLLALLIKAGLLEVETKAHGPGRGGRKNGMAGHPTTYRVHVDRGPFKPGRPKQVDAANVATSTYSEQVDRQNGRMSTYSGQQVDKQNESMSTYTKQVDKNGKQVEKSPFGVSTHPIRSINARTFVKPDETDPVVPALASVGLSEPQIGQILAARRYTADECAGLGPWYKKLQADPRVKSPVAIIFGELIAGRDIPTPVVVTPKHTYPEPSPATVEAARKAARAALARGRQTPPTDDEIEAYLPVMLFSLYRTRLFNGGLRTW